MHYTNTYREVYMYIYLHNAVIVYLHGHQFGRPRSREADYLCENKDTISDIHTLYMHTYWHVY